MKVKVNLDTNKILKAYVIFNYSSVSSSEYTFSFSHNSPNSLNYEYNESKPTRIEIESRDKSALPSVLLKETNISTIGC